MLFFGVASPSRRKNCKALRQATSRRLLVEQLESRRLLSAAAPQQLSFASLPSLAQQAIAAQIGEQAKLTAPDYAPDDFGFGSSVAMSGNTIVVGAPYATIGNDQSQGAVYVFVRTGPSWSNMTQVAKLIASDGKAGDEFGEAVAISGNTIVVGTSPPASSGLPHEVVMNVNAYLFVEPAAGWANMTQNAKLTVSDPSFVMSNASSVAVSSDTVVLGVSSVMVSGNTDEGEVYVFTRPATGWANMAQTAKLTAPDGAANDSFATSVSVDGNTIAVGANGAAVGGNTNAGAVYVFTETASSWTTAPQVAKLTPSDTTQNLGFGGAVSLSGNTLVAGSDAATYLFAKPAAGWADATQTAKLSTAGGAGSGQHSYVAISGSTVAVVLPTTFTLTGNVAPTSVYVFAKPASGWTNMTPTATLTSSVNLSAVALNASPIAISGDTVVLAATGDTNGVGTAFTFTRTGQDWTKTSPAAKLTAVRTSSDGPPLEGLGEAVALSGNTLVIGAPWVRVGGNANQGAAFVFVRSGAAWTEAAELTASNGSACDQFGCSVAIEDGTVVIGAEDALPASFGSGLPSYLSGRKGAAYLFAKPATGWANMKQTAMLTSTDGAAGDYFGESVAVSGGTIAVGAPGELVGGNSFEGAVYLFAKPFAGWTNMTQSAKLTTSDGAAGSQLGGAVSIDGNSVVAINSSAAYVFVKPRSGWANMTQTAKLTTPVGLPNNQFTLIGAPGRSIAVRGNTIVLSVFQSPPSYYILNNSQGTAVDNQTTAGGNDQPLAYVFTMPASGWANMTPTATLSVSNALVGGGFTTSIALSGNSVVVGVVPLANSQGTTGRGSAFVFTESASGWANTGLTSNLIASDGSANDSFGASVAIDGETAVVGAPNVTAGQGAAYLFSSSPVTITSSPSKSAIAGLKYSYLVKTGAGPGEKITFALSVKPSGMSIDAASGLINWTPSAAQTGTAAVTVRAMDQFGNFDVQTFSIRVFDPFLFYLPKGPVLPSTSQRTLGLLIG